MGYETVQPNEVPQEQAAAQFWEVIQPNGVLRALARKQLRGVGVKIFFAIVIMYLIDLLGVVYELLKMEFPETMPAEMSPIWSTVYTTMTVASFVTSGAFLLGFAGYCLKCVRNQTVKVKNIFDGFKRFIHSFLLMFFTTLFTFLWGLLLIVPGIIKCLGYSMVFYIMYDNPGVKPLEALKKSQIMMEGYKWKLFKLMFSFFVFAFVGVMILAISWISLLLMSTTTWFDAGCTMLIALLAAIFLFWLHSFTGLSMANFYENLKRVREKAGASDVNFNDETACAADFAIQNYKQGNDNSSLLPKAFMFTMIIIISATTAFAQIPDIKWYTAKQKAKTYEISTADELAGLAALVNDMAGLKGAIDFEGKTIILTRDIDLSKYGRGAKFNDGRGWIPIGHCIYATSYNSERGSKLEYIVDSDADVDDDTGIRYVECNGVFDEQNRYPRMGPTIFRGVFDGNGKAIRGLYSRAAIGSDCEELLTYIPGGLFGNIRGTIKNLGIVDADVIGGGIVGMLENGGDVASCYFSGKVVGNNIVGGIIGWMLGGNISNSYFTGTVSGIGSIGGIVGENNSGNISNCYSAGTINGEAGVGGIVGTLEGRNSTVSNCYSIATVNGTSSVGGIVGFVNNLGKTAEYDSIRWDFAVRASTSAYYCSMEYDSTRCYPGGLPAEHFYKQIENITQFDTLKNSVSNSIALNPSVSAKGSEESIPLVTIPDWFEELGFRISRSLDSSFNRGGRVIGGSDAGKFSNNAAFRGITNISGNTS